MIRFNRLRGWLLVTSASVWIAACGGDNSALSSGDAASSGEPALSASSATGTLQAAQSPSVGMAGSPATPAAAQEATLIMPAAWMPTKWDSKNLFLADGGSVTAVENAQRFLSAAPLEIWLLANDTLLDETFEPIWVWWTAVQSCERAIKLIEDLTGEFGDRERGKAALTVARNELKAFAATQPRELTIHFPASLQQWNEAMGGFPIGGMGGVSAIPIPQLEKALGARTYLQGEVQLYSDRTSVGLSHFRASVGSLTCPDKGGNYTISKDSQWRVVFGDAQLGMGGLVSYRKRFELPVVPMSREQAAAYAEKNPQRKVNVSVTFTRAGEGFQGQSQDFLVRGAISRLTIADAVDGTVLVNKTY